MIKITEIIQPLNASPASSRKGLPMRKISLYGTILALFGFGLSVAASAQTFTTLSFRAPTGTCMAQLLQAEPRAPTQAGGPSIRSSHQAP